MSTKNFSSLMKKSELLQDKDLFECLLRHEGLKKLRVLFDSFADRPVWWIVYRSHLSPSALKANLETSFKVWEDPRSRNFPYARRLSEVLKKRTKQTLPFTFSLPGGLINHSVPLVVSGRLIGFLGFTGRKNGIRQGLLAFLSDYTHLILESCVKTEELSRLSATIRPGPSRCRPCTRCIALSILP